MSKGTIKFYSSEKGYGFIYIKHSREDMYFHINDWKNQTPPVVNDDVEFETTISRGKFKAINIRVIKSSAEKKEENFAKNDDRVICPGCGKKIVPRLIIRDGKALHSMCPYCATVVREFDEYCFIATAIYKDYNHPKVITLRKFRDDFLLTNGVGKSFVKFYYKNSPKFANYIKDKKVLSYPIRKILDGFSYLLEKYFNKQKANKI